MFSGAYVNLANRWYAYVGTSYTGNNRLTPSRKVLIKNREGTGIPSRTLTPLMVAYPSPEAPCALPSGVRASRACRRPPQWSAGSKGASYASKWLCLTFFSDRGFQIMVVSQFVDLRTPSATREDPNGHRAMWCHPGGSLRCPTGSSAPTPLPAG